MLSMVNSIEGAAEAIEGSYKSRSVVQKNTNFRKWYDSGNRPASLSPTVLSMEGFLHPKSSTSGLFFWQVLAQKFGRFCRYYAKTSEH